MSAQVTGRPSDAVDARSGADGVVRAAAAIAALVSAAVVVALIVFYANGEVTSPPPHVWGPISDIGTACWNVVAAPLFWGLGRAALDGGRGSRALCAATCSLSVIAAGTGTLLVVRVLDFGIATTISVAAILLQTVWLLVVGRAMARSTGWRRSTARVATISAATLLGGAAVAALSLVLGWGSPAQTVVLVVGLVPGLLGWAGWPVWFALLALEPHRVR